MRYAVVTKDKPDSLELRISNRDAHLNYIEQTGAVELAGPFLDDNGNMCGSLVILNVDSLQAAQDWAASDPYARAGLFETVSVQQWKKVIG